ncbi:nuclear transport factor 2 family protein [Roseobacter denitrificans]|nr:nuclear transport factor 2 family protein [Roseobacter denitrificans]AVL53439.1 nuclear transport factor 2 family protein [Roseobacter denitrificans]SFF71036.1 SnoaL-like domain-containing protein [Roseobacter denitrificans OCh 114]
MDYAAFAVEWEAAWNSHAIDRIMAHYALDVVFRSRKAMRLVGQGEIRGRDALRDYWIKALDQQPGLSFIVTNVFIGHAMIVITYRNQNDVEAAETLRFGPDGLVIEASACHRVPSHSL